MRYLFVFALLVVPACAAQEPGEPSAAIKSDMNAVLASKEPATERADTVLYWQGYVMLRNCLPDSLQEKLDRLPMAKLYRSRYGPSLVTGVWTSPDTIVVLRGASVRTMAHEILHYLTPGDSNHTGPLWAKCYL